MSAHCMPEEYVKTMQRQFQLHQSATFDVPFMCPSKRKIITRFWRKRSRTRHVLPLPLDAIPAVLESPKLYSRVFEYITYTSHTTTHTALNLTQCWKPVSPVPPFSKSCSMVRSERVGLSLVLIHRSSYQGVGYRLQPRSQRGGYRKYSAFPPLPQPADPSTGTPSDGQLSRSARHRSTGCQRV